MKLCFTILMTLGCTAAHAGCANFTDGSLRTQAAPVYRICYDTVCDVTTQDYVCSNANSYQAGYAVGWETDCQFKNGDPANEVCTISWQGRPIDPVKHNRITFTALEE